MSHAWCRDIPRDEAVRAAEDNRPGPLPTLEEAISGVTERRPPEPRGGGNVTGGMRTERVTLEVTHDLDAPLGDWIVQVIDESLGFDESVRVVDNTAERITQALTADRFASAVAEADTLRARVAELESSAKLAPAANADGGSNHAAPAASGVRSEHALREHVAAIVHDAMRFEREGITPTWQAGNSYAESRARQAALEIVALLNPSAAPAASGAAGRGWLNEVEREALDAARDYFDNDDHGDSECVFIARVLKQILARSSPPEVVRPRQPSCPLGRHRRSWDHACLAMQRDYDSALAAAGVTCKEVV